MGKSSNPPQSRLERVALWLVFVAMVALLPILASWIIGYLGSGAPTLRELLAEGDGFLVAVAITADAIGRAIDKKKARIVFPAILSGVLLCVSLLCFANVRTEISNQKNSIHQALANAREHVIDNTPVKVGKDRSALNQIERVLHSGKPKSDEQARALANGRDTIQAMLKDQADAEAALQGLTDAVSNPKNYNEDSIERLSKLCMLVALITSFWVIIL